MHREERGSGQLGFSEKDFKVCDLCGALNRAENTECFVCGWYGTFRTDPETVRQVMAEFEAEYGTLNESIVAEELLPDESSGPGWFATFIEKIKAFLSGREADR
ncbi:MAG TPA: hypothetical protein PLU88_04865 [Armatimonadota bacterium]|mgnify:CR=1 FL=1|nr:hypothetical protein [Armatimonadota bacterium]HPP74440.1 hypothetical protein [Armatimonadota bacterium]